MSIDYSSSMIVGRMGSDFNSHEDLCEWAEDNELEVMASYYDAPIEHSVIGYQVDDIKAADIDEFTETVKGKAAKFKEISGLEANLIGAISVW